MNCLTIALIMAIIVYAVNTAMVLDKVWHGDFGDSWVDYGQLLTAVSLATSIISVITGVVE